LLTRCLNENLTDQVRAIIQGVEPAIEDIQIGAERNNPLVYALYEGRGVPVALAGDGIYSLVRTALALVTRPKGSVLVEEPEVHQHPAGMRQAIRAILAAVHHDIQVVLTTHSLELVDILLAEATEDNLAKLSLYRMELENGSLISHRLPGKKVARARLEIVKDLR
jgi:predicted ATPase